MPVAVSSLKRIQPVRDKAFFGLKSPQRRPKQKRGTYVEISDTEQHGLKRKQLANSSHTPKQKRRKRDNSGDGAGPSTSSTTVIQEQRANLPITKGASRDLRLPPLLTFFRPRRAD